MSPAKLLPGPYTNKCAGGLQTEMERHRIKGTWGIINSSRKLLLRMKLQYKNRHCGFLIRSMKSEKILKYFFDVK